MAELINLRAKRKAVAKAATRQQADENAVKYGLTKAERHLLAAQAEKSARDLDGKKRDQD